MKLWGGRFTKATHQFVEEVNASIDVDQELAEEDILGSIAHVEMLATCEILTKDEADQIIAGLQTILKRFQAGEIEFTIENEDIHMNVEALLIEEIGEVAKKLHTGRSRNDQVALDMHLYMRKQTLHTIQLLIELQEALIEQAEQHMDTLLPGYTHLQRAQPIRLSHHLTAYVSMFERDIARLQDSYKRVDLCPLGAGAIAGTTFPIDRHWVAERLGFSQIYDNSMDAVSDRDYLIEFLSHASLIMVHLSRLAEELILWSSDEFGYVELDDAFTTGSSMMPQKKNPDIPELVRGKTGRVYGHLMALLTTLKALPLTYNKDLQEDKQGVFDTVKTLDQSLRLMKMIIATMQVNTEQMQNNIENSFVVATDLADYLVRKKVSFREAHEISGKIVLSCIQQNKHLIDCTLEEFQTYSPLIEADVFQALAPETVVEARISAGGTSKKEVEQTIKNKKENMVISKEWMTNI